MDQDDGFGHNKMDQHDGCKIGFRHNKMDQNDGLRSNLWYLKLFKPPKQDLTLLKA